MTALRDQVDWLGLPPDVQETIQTIGPLIVLGFSVVEMARHLHKNESCVTERIAELREAMLSHAGELEERLRERAEELRVRASPGRPRAG